MEPIWIRLLILKRSQDISTCAVREMGVGCIDVKIVPLFKKPDVKSLKSPLRPSLGFAEADSRQSTPCQHPFKMVTDHFTISRPSPSTLAKIGRASCRERA